MRTNKQSDHSPGGGSVTFSIWLVPGVLHFWALLLYMVTILAMGAHGASPICE